MPFTQPVIHARANYSYPGLKGSGLVSSDFLDAKVKELTISGPEADNLQP